MSNFAEMFVLGYLLRKNMALRANQTLTLAGAIKREPNGGWIYETFTTFNPVHEIAQNCVNRRKIEK